MHINSNKHTILVPLQTTILITTELWELNLTHTIKL